MDISLQVKLIAHAMIDNLRTQTLVEKIYVSPLSHSLTSFIDRDKEVKAFSGTIGTILGKLIMQQIKVILVMVDYASLSNNIQAIRNFPELLVAYQVEIYESQTLMKVIKLEVKSDCRSGSVYRSK
ncbi:unnamed protein product [Cunninghamella blakesleeana]